MLHSIHRSRKQCAAFTLLELLIVIGIITILIVLGLSVGAKVLGTGKVAATTQTLRVLDEALSDFIQATGGNPPPFIVDPREANNGGKYLQAVIDGRCESTGQIVNSVGFFMFQCRAVPAANAALKHLDPKFIREYTPDSPTPTALWDNQPSLPTAMDAWGHPIRYVHPFFKGLIPNPPSTYVTLKATAPVGNNEMLVPGAGPANQFGMPRVRRSNADTAAGSVAMLDADGGLNPATRPYFYSTGPDGLAGFGLDASSQAMDYNKDNVYITTPRVQKAP
jgi:type II secretory pathway pseudopilin PulG